MPANEVDWHGLSHHPHQRRGGGRKEHVRRHSHQLTRIGPQRLAQRRMHIAAEPPERQPQSFKDAAQLASDFVREGLMSEVEARETLEDIAESVGLVAETSEGLVAIIRG